MGGTDYYIPHLSRKGVDRKLMISKKDRFNLWLFTIPALLIIIVAQAYPLLDSLITSFRNWSLATSPEPTGLTLDNYIHVIKDPAFLYACKISLKYMIVATIGEIILGFILGYALTGDSLFIKVSRTILIIPMVIAPVAVGTMWRIFFDSNNGMFNYLLSFIGIKGPDWLGDPHFALWGSVIVDIWQWTSFAMIIYVASMGSISHSVIEAAKMDGCTSLQKIFRIIWPLVKPATILILIFRMIDTFFVFDQVYSLTYGGPGTSTQVVSLYIYNQGLKYFNISQAAATSWLVMIVSIVIAILLLKLKDRAEKAIY